MPPETKYKQPAILTLWLQFFSSNRLSLLDRGWIYAIAHVRGGGEMGRFWYEDGKYKKKINTFKDFIACAGAWRGQADETSDREGMVEECPQEDAV
jgi:protease II